MPTKKPRITVTLPAPVYETITRMAKLTGQSRGAIIGELIETCHPPLMRTVALLEAASAAPSQVQQGLRETIEGMEKAAQASVDANIAQMDWLHTAFGASADSGSGSSEGDRKPPRKRSNPRTCNTGVRSSKSTKSGK